MSQPTPQDAQPKPSLAIRIIRVPIALAACFLALLIGHAAWTLHTSLPITEDGPATVDILPGSFAKNLQRLHENGTVPHPLYLRIYLKATGQAPTIRAGRYTLLQGTTPIRMVEAFTKTGKHTQIRFTVPEGWTLYHIADRLEDMDIVPRDTFIATATDRDALNTLKIPSSTSAEGYLFPDTYLLRPGQSAQSILSRMVSRHRTVWGNEYKDLSKAQWDSLTKTLKLGSHDLITIASIIEREAVTDAERPLIARVIYNRLRKGMKLQVDPTCVYGPTRYTQKPSPTLCKDPKNTHSTYVHKGLPPTPISNPGRASIHAALHPSDKPAHQNYLYFVADPARSGQHTFSNTYKEHMKAVQSLREASNTP